MHRAFALRALAHLEHGLPVQRRDAHAQHAPIIHQHATRVFTHPSMTEAFNNLFLPQNMQE